MAGDFAVELGGMLRALDHEMASRPNFSSPPSHPASYLCEEVGTFVIPRRNAKRNDGGTGPGRGFGRRATPHHRILPQVVAGRLEVELLWDTRLSAGRADTANTRLGAALFPKMKLERDPSRKDWIAASADAPDDEAAIELQVTQGFAANVLAIVFPELSMPPQRLASLKSRLKSAARVSKPGAGPSVIAAGSWHVPSEDGFKNVMPILDQTGKQRFSYEKAIAFHRNQVQEGILVGTKLPVLVNTDFLATFAICLDFCESELATPYAELDVDLVLVASHGNHQTMKGHEGKAIAAAARHGTRTFVVQHTENCMSPVGYVYPGLPTATNMDEDEPWSVRLISLG